MGKFSQTPIPYSGPKNSMARTIFNILKVFFLPLLLRFLPLAASLIILNAVSDTVFTVNQQKGIYPIDADSIGIPIMEIFLSSIVILPLLAGISFFGLLNRHIRDESKKGFVTILIIEGLGYAASFYLTVIWSLEYFQPNHYAITAGYLLLFVLLTVFLINDTRSLLFKRPSIQVRPVEKIDNQTEYRTLLKIILACEIIFVLFFTGIFSPGWIFR